MIGAVVLKPSIWQGGHIATCNGTLQFPYGYSFYYNVLIDSLLVLGPLVADPLHMP